jgi:hypothetical protein
MGNRSMFVGLDVHKETIDVSIAEGDRHGEVRHYGVTASDLEPFDKVVRTLRAPNLPGSTSRLRIVGQRMSPSGLAASADDEQGWCPRAPLRLAGIEEHRYHLLRRPRPRTPMADEPFSAPDRGLTVEHEGGIMTAFTVFIYVVAQLAPMLRP